MKKTAMFVIAALGILLSGCTENQRAKSMGGTMTVTLPAGTKFVNATWKGEELWYLTRPMHTNESAETHAFKEKSSFGIVEGTVLFVEAR